MFLFQVRAALREADGLLPVLRRVNLEARRRWVLQGFSHAVAANS